jgi:phage gp36-like protein
VADEPKVYADAEDFDVPQGTLDAATAEDIERSLRRASRLADSYLCPPFTYPILQWGEDVRLHVAAIATWLILRKVGFSPDQEDAKSIRQGYDDAIDWLSDVHTGKATPVGLVDSSPGGGGGGTEEGLPSSLLLTNRPGPVEIEVDDFWEKQGPLFTGTGLGKPRPRGW